MNNEQCLLPLAVLYLLVATFPIQNTRLTCLRKNSRFESCFYLFIIEFRYTQSILFKYHGNFIQSKLVFRREANRPLRSVPPPSFCFLFISVILRYSFVLWGYAIWLHSVICNRRKCLFSSLQILADFTPCNFIAVYHTWKQYKYVRHDWVPCVKKMPSFFSIMSL